MLVILLVLTTFILCPDEGDAVKPGLKLAALGPKRVKGTYQYNDTLGIQFDIRLSSVEMKTLKGDALAAYLKLARDANYFQIADRGFLSVEKKLVRAVPKEVPKTREALYRFAKQQSTDDEENVMQTHEAALEKLRKFDEIRLFKAASRAIANEGGSGTKLEITQPYHLLSLNLLKALDKMGKPVYLLADGASKDSSERPYHPFRTKRCASLEDDPNGNNCYGMCGKGCDCWKWVCDDCCYHQGCWEHDYCCRKDWYSKYCLFYFLYDFTCDSYGGYDKC